MRFSVKSGPPNSGSVATAEAAYEHNLNEIGARTGRQATATYGYSALEDSGNNYTWQPETLIYADSITGNEVVRFTTSAGIRNRFHDDIGMANFSADGKRMLFQSSRDTGAFTKDTTYIWMTAQVNGTALRPTVEAVNRGYNHNPYAHWSPQIVDVYYAFARNDNGNTGQNEYVLYKQTVSDSAVSPASHLTFPSTVSTELFLNKTISGDGKKVVAMPWAESWLYPATIEPTPALDDSDGHDVDRVGGTGWGDTPASYTAHHDQYMGGDGTWMWILPSGSHAWWHIQTTGTNADGGADYSFSAPSTFGECVPENTVDAWGGTNDPFGSTYWSHFTIDRWDRVTLFSHTDASPTSPGTWDVSTHAYVGYTYGTGSATQHHDWSGFSDYFISTGGGDGVETSTAIYSCKYDGDSGDTIKVCEGYHRNNGGTAYDTLTRPGQSPDGTKVQFHSEYLNAGTDIDCFWAVVYYPYPPTDLAASGTGQVDLTWLPPKYTARGWPDESSDSAPYAREIAQYRVWRSTSSSGPWTALGTVAQTYSNHATYGLYAATGDCTYTDTPSDGTWYYALTTEENCGICSDELSMILQVTVSSSNVTGTATAAAQGQTGFYTTLPSDPSSVSFTAEATAGHVTITATEPTDTSGFVRYYNVYYSTNGTPPATQKFLAWSIPKGSLNGFIDWLADQGAVTHQYRITTVDRYRNESTGATGTT